MSLTLLVARLLLRLTLNLRNSISYWHWKLWAQKCHWAGSVSWCATMDSWSFSGPWIELPGDIYNWFWKNISRSEWCRSIPVNCRFYIIGPCSPDLDLIWSLNTDHTTSRRKIHESSIGCYQTQRKVRHCLDRTFRYQNYFPRTRERTYILQFHRVQWSLRSRGTLIDILGKYT